MRSINDEAIVLDWKNGSVSNATWRERMGLAMLRLAAVTTQSPERPGFSKLAAAISHIFPSDRFVRVRFCDDTLYQFPYGDGYWSVLCAPGFTYEREIEGFVKRCAQEGIAYTFVDCGANFGYWSCRISSQNAGGQKAIAIEASSESYGHTMRNRALNDNRFVAHHRAVSDQHGVQLTIESNTKHEQRAVGGVATSADAETVRAVALAKLKDVDPETENIVVKLDVEGLEIAALHSAGDWLDHRTLVIFEDHGSDLNHENARAFQDQFGLQIFAGSPEGKFTRIDDFSQMDAIKTVRRKGYDFFATKSPFWLDFLSENV
ncbi:MAG: FkbM family methyltransferase [Ahrensia sp.]|nr:FkbM family methyltransferase [Ahrensia sp.]